ncbi:Uncharacterised protein [Candidatus Norongarragalina meridionalis]|nr:Uncharacterised protein [Candidatus Norongarragalina meridionalis]
MNGRFVVTFLAFALLGLGVADAFLGFSGSIGFFSTFLTGLLIFLTFFTFFFLPPKEIFSEKGWRYISVGLVVLFIGRAIKEYCKMTGSPLGFPSFADLFWFFGFIPIGYGLLLLCRAFHVELTTPRKIAVATASAAFAVFIFFIAILPALLDANGADPSDAASIIKNLWDLALFTLSAYLLAMLWRWHRLAEPVVLLTLGLAIITVYDTVNGRISMAEQMLAAFYSLRIFAYFLFVMAAVRYKTVSEEIGSGRHVFGKK